MSDEKSKTNTIKQRRVDVYLPSLEMKEKWSEIADERGQSLSKFVIETVENTINNTEEDFESRRELLQENRDLKEKVKDLKEEVEMHKKSYEKVQDELKEHRAKEFTPSVTNREYTEELVDLLRKREFVRFEDIYDELNIEPSDTEMVKAFQEQLKALEEYGLVEEKNRGWRWKG